MIVFASITETASDESMTAVSILSTTETFSSRLITVSSALPVKAECPGTSARLSVGRTDGERGEARSQENPCHRFPPKAEAIEPGCTANAATVRAREEGKAEATPSLVAGRAMGAGPAGSGIAQSLGTAAHRIRSPDVCERGFVTPGCTPASGR
jgi:hypothetical protein